MEPDCPATEAEDKPICMLETVVDENAEPEAVAETTAATDKTEKLITAVLQDANNDSSEIHELNVQTEIDSKASTLGDSTEPKTTVVSDVETDAKDTASQQSVPDSAVSDVSVKDKAVLDTKSSDTDTKVTDKNSSSNNCNNTVNILSLPIDSLHNVASFLPLSEWANFGLASQSSLRVYRTVIHRVRMHGFKCASEIVAAWKLQQHADCKELVALYIFSGVPIYPKSLGHSYHTLQWRMSVEAQHLIQKQQQENSRQQQQQENSSNSSNSSTNSSNIDSEEFTSRTTATIVDPFYTDLPDFRRLNEYSSDVTYLEEKSLYYLNKRLAVAQAPPRFSTSSIAAAAAAANNSNRSLHGHLNNNDNNNNMLAHGARTINRRTQFEDLINSMHSQNKPRNASPYQQEPPKITLNVHQHLLDQHMKGQLVTNDLNGELVAPPINLAADFYHSPHNAMHIRRAVEQYEQFASENTDTATIFPSILSRPTATLVANTTHGPIHGPHMENENVDFINVDLEDLEADDIFELRAGGIPSDEDDLSIPNRSTVSSSSLSSSLVITPAPLPQHRINAILKFTDIELYSAACDTSLACIEIKTYLKSRFATYQRRLDGFLLNNDSNGFDECMLDFWDEFFPHTAMIHYHDRLTAVPRVSCLQKFLTRPCPKSIGVVKCEIERIKTSTKGKGVSMKGRFFPTYEYRLFIKHRPHHSAALESAFATDNPDFERRDTVLMTAKHRGRKYMEASGARSVTPTNKKGSNNYFLQIPQQVDVDEHYNNINETSAPTKLNSNGASHEPVLVSKDGGSPLLGRLQSNFIGTEFQIFTPRMRKRHSRKVRAFLSPSDDECDYDNDAPHDSLSSSGRRSSRFGRLSLRRNAHPDSALDCNMSDTSSVRSVPGHRRTKSCPPVQGARTLRRVANTPDSKRSLQAEQHVMTEEEDGVITYTANLLGSRPRIMDVCIPKISPDGVAGELWRRYLDSLEEPVDEGQMLRCFRKLQQRLDTQEQNGVNNIVAGEDETNGPQEDNLSDSNNPGVGMVDENFGLTALQNRPPWWNIELGSFVLNFGGRVSVASVKNFQLCERQDQDNILLQFGRIQGRHSFTMDFQYPLTAVQAFAIAISSLQSKLSFG